MSFSFGRQLGVGSFPPHTSGGMLAYAVALLHKSGYLKFHIMIRSVRIDGSYLCVTRVVKTNGIWIIPPANY